MSGFAMALAAATIGLMALFIAVSAETEQLQYDLTACEALAAEVNK